MSIEGMRVHENGELSELPIYFNSSSFAPRNPWGGEHAQPQQTMGAKTSKP